MADIKALDDVKTGAAGNSGTGGGGGKLAAIVAGNAAAAGAGGVAGGVSKPRDNSKDKSREARHRLLLDKKVIDGKVIQDAVRDEILSSKDGKADDFKELLDRGKLSEVSSLILSFKHIHVIDNLNGFNRLIKLQLDNNLIEKITNLEHLTNLQWLDLSFNHITVIEGLDQLTQLTDLSLYNNHIRHLTGLSALKNLNVLSVGNNNIRDVSEIVELRPFKNLRLLNLKGNPVGEDPEYHNTVFAYLQNLRYLDYQLIEPAQRKMAEDAIKSDHKEKLESDDVAREQAARADEKKAARIASMNQAGMEGLSTLYDDLIKADAEWSKIQLFPDVMKVMDGYKAGLEKVLNDFINQMLDKYQLKEKERKCFESVYAKVCAKNEQKSRTKIQNFDRRKKQMFRLYDETKKQYEELKRTLDDSRRTAGPNSTAPATVFMASLTVLTREMEKWTEREGEIRTVTSGFSGTGAGSTALWGMTKSQMMATVKDMLYRKESVAAVSAAGSAPYGITNAISAATATPVLPDQMGGLDIGDTRDIKYELAYFGLNKDNLTAPVPAATATATSGAAATPNSALNRTTDLRSPLSPSAAAGSGASQPLSPPGTAPGNSGAAAIASAAAAANSGGGGAFNAAPPVQASVYNPHSSVPPHKQLLETLKRELLELSDQLMDLEVLLTEQLNGVIDNFELAYKTIKDDNGTRISQVASALQDVCTHHFEALTELHRSKLEKLQKEELIPRPPEAVVQLISDKDTVNHSLEASKNTHSGLIGETETELGKREEDTYAKLSKDIHRANIQRNRQRVTEIAVVTAKYMQEIIPKLEANEDDDY